MTLMGQQLRSLLLAFSNSPQVAGPTNPGEPGAPTPARNPLRRAWARWKWRKNWPAQEAH